MIDTKINIETISMNSNSLLNTSKKDDTMKVYYPSLVSGEELTKDYNKEEIQCFANFNYNLKYINKYIKFKDDYINSKKLFFLLLMKSRTLIKKMFQIHKTKRISKTKNVIKMIKNQLYLT